MRLDQGPTASFKDFAARLMARLMHYFAKKENKDLTVLVATSGDTGGAVAAAFHNLENVNVVVLFPEKEVTGRQRKQMTTLGKNVRAVAVKGKFDDCQALVKRAFNDPDLSRLNLTSANSINFSRLMPQIVYYIYAYSRLAKDKIIFSVPSGNFGNLMGGIIAKEMGLPVEKFIVAVNENDEFPNFLKSGNYKPVVPSKECSSNAMNVGHPSNLARLIGLYGGWLTDERDEDGKVIKKGVLKEKPDMEKMKKDFISFSIKDKEVDETIKDTCNKYNIMLEPHGAVAIAAVNKANLNGLVVSLETADPAKFPEKIRELLKVDPKVPKSLSGLDNKEESFDIIENNYNNFKEKIK
jgi:threonine synthase